LQLEKIGPYAGRKNDISTHRTVLPGFVRTRFWFRIPSDRRVF
jgi:hypothetical protein